MKDVPATLVENLFVDGEPNSPGSFKFATHVGESEPCGISFVCPCGCGSILGIRLRFLEGGGPVWQWNGDRERPTITPSVRRLGGCEWHGFLTDGVFRTC